MIGRLRTAAIAILGLTGFPPGASAAVDFQPAQPYAASAPWWSATADVNGDGKLDSVTASYDTNVISVLLGNGDGSFQAPLNTAAAPNRLTGITAGDLNGDGKADVAVAVQGTPGTVRVYLSNGDGTLDAGTPYAAGNFPQDVVITQIDGNSSPDLAVANQGAPNPTVSVYLNNGAGAFAPASGSPIVFAGNEEPLGMGAADFDADGKNDLVVGAANGMNPGVLFLKGAGTGGFAAPVPLGGIGAQDIATGDLNGDGRPDLVANRATVGDVVIITRGASGFNAPTTVDPDGPMGSANGRLALADFDGDGVPDLAVPNTVGPQANKVSVMLGNGDATFQDATHHATGSFPRQVVAGDFNRDGHPDLAASTSGVSEVTVLLAVPPAVTLTPASLAFADQLEGTASPAQTITVRNDGTRRLRPTGVTLTGADAAQFTVASDTCTGANLAVGATCTVGIAFTPVGAGSRVAGVAIATNGAGSPHAAELTGEALAVGACANVFRGTTAADVLAGTFAGDRLVALAGNDRVNGLAGADCLNGGRGKDRLNGGADADRLTGGAGNDRASGGAGRDTESGGAGNDRLTGGSGRDTLVGGAGRDKLTGGGGRNSYRAGKGRDVVNARNRVRETVDCGPGRDSARVDRRDTVRHCERVRRS